MTKNFDTFDLCPAGHKMTDQRNDKMNAYEMTVTAYNKLILAIVNNPELSKSEKFVQQIQIKLQWEPIIAKALLETMKVF